MYSKYGDDTQSSDSNEKEAFILKNTINDTEVTSQKVTLPITSSNKFNPLSGGLSNLNLGTNPTPFSIPPITEGAGFSLNDLAQAHINRASAGELNPTKPINGVNFHLDFNNLNIGKGKGTTDCSAWSAKELTNKITPITLNYTPSATPSLSSLAKQHEKLIDKTDCSNKSPFTVSTSSGFKIPSLFGESSQITSASPSSTSLVKQDIPAPSNLLGAQIDLSSALLSKVDRPIKRQSLEESTILTPLSEHSKRHTATTEQLLASIDLLFSSNSSRDHSYIKNQKRNPSSFAKVLCRKWKQNNAKKLSGNPFNTSSFSPIKKFQTKTSNGSKDIKPFRFDVPSPDDVIVAAQSKVFGRRQ